jgi:hypothetical protein
MANLSNINNKFIVEDSGDVGIGVTTATTKLHIGGTAPGDSIIRQDSTVSGTNWEIGERAAGKWQIFEDDGDTIVATFMSTGNVGIGTDSPNQKITIGFADNGTDGISFRSTTYASLGKILCENDNSSTNGNLQFYTRSGGDVLERMRIDSSGNVGIGTDSPDSYNLGSTGKTLAINSTSASVGSLLNMETAGVKRGYLFANSSNVVLSAVHTGIPLKFNTEDTTRLTIDSSGNSTFAGNVNAPSVLANGFMEIRSDTASLYFENAANNNYYRLKRSSNDFVIDYYNGSTTSDRLTIDSSGNVGIGTDSPTARLNVKASGSTVDQIAVTHSGNTVEIAQLGQSANGNSAGALLLKTNGGTDTVYLDAAGTSYINGGNVGIGTTTNINAPLTVQASGGANAINIIGRDNGTADESIIDFYQNDGTTRMAYMLADDGNLDFATGGSTVRMRITSGGVVEAKAGFSATLGTAFYQLNDNGDGGILATQDTAKSIGMVSGNSYAGGSNYSWIKFTGGASANVIVRANNNGVQLATNATSWSSFSDETLKENIKPLENVLDQN